MILPRPTRVRVSFVLSVCLILAICGSNRTLAQPFPGEAIAVANEDVEDATAGFVGRWYMLDDGEKMRHLHLDLAEDGTFVWTLVDETREGRWQSRSGFLVLLYFSDGKFMPLVLTRQGHLVSEKHGRHQLEFVRD